MKEMDTEKFHEFMEQLYTTIDLRRRYCEGGVPEWSMNDQTRKLGRTFRDLLGTIKDVK